MNTLACAVALVAALNIPPKDVPAVYEVAKYKSNDMLVLAAIESKFNQQAVSSVGALGVMQLTPIAVKEVYQVGCPLALPPKPDVTRLHDNLTIGACYLLHLQKTFNDNMYLVIAAYNAGPSAAVKLAALKNIPHETALHVLKFHILKRKVKQCSRN
jgi:soluble lytic murein transglycosylase-like protein